MSENGSQRSETEAGVRKEKMKIQILNKLNSNTLDNTNASLWFLKKNRRTNIIAANSLSEQLKTKS